LPSGDFNQDGDFITVGPLMLLPSEAEELNVIRAYQDFLLSSIAYHYSNL